MAFSDKMLWRCEAKRGNAREIVAGEGPPLGNANFLFFTTGKP